MKNKIQKILLIIPIVIILILFITISVSASLNVSLSDQGTGVREKSTNSLVLSGNLTVDIYDDPTAGTLIYNEVFTNVINNGSWNIMLGENSSNPLPLEYGKKYYKDYKINNEDADFTNSTGGTIERLFFYSPLGDISGEDLSQAINITITGNINATGNVTASWFRGLFNWLIGTASLNYLSFNGSTLDLTTNVTQWLYNQTYSGSTYNATYALWTYNQTTPAINTLNNSYGIFWYNQTIGISSGNLSWNETRANLLYSPIVWNYNQTQPFTDWLSTFLYNYNQTIMSNIFNQQLNTSSNATFYNITVSNEITINGVKVSPWLFNQSNIQYNFNQSNIQYNFNQSNIQYNFNQSNILYNYNQSIFNLNFSFGQNLTAYSCSGTDKVTGIGGNGTMICGTDSTADTNSISNLSLSTITNTTFSTIGNNTYIKLGNAITNDSNANLTSLNVTGRFNALSNAIIVGNLTVGTLTTGAGGNNWIQIGAGNAKNASLKLYDYDTTYGFTLQNNGVLPAGVGSFQILRHNGDANGIVAMTILRTNGFVAIGTQTPTYLLDVNGNFSANKTLYVNTNGKVGIGTVSPSSALHIQGSGALLNVSNSSD